MVRKFFLCLWSRGGIGSWKGLPSKYGPKDFNQKIFDFSRLFDFPPKASSSLRETFSPSLSITQRLEASLEITAKGRSSPQLFPLECFFLSSSCSTSLDSFQFQTSTSRNAKLFCLCPRSRAKAAQTQIKQKRERNDWINRQFRV
jgi:hypothetical protein